MARIVRAIIVNLAGHFPVHPALPVSGSPRISLSQFLCPESRRNSKEFNTSSCLQCLFELDQFCHARLLNSQFPCVHCIFYGYWFFRQLELKSIMVTVKTLATIRCKLLMQEERDYVMLLIFYFHCIRVYLGSIKVILNLLNFTCFISSTLPLNKEVAFENYCQYSFVTFQISVISYLFGNTSLILAMMRYLLTYISGFLIVWRLEKEASMMLWRSVLGIARS